MLLFKILNWIYFNTSTLKSDQHLISLYNITPKPNMQVMRIKEMVTN